jgi:hypothetical protein
MKTSSAHFHLNLLGVTNSAEVGFVLEGCSCRTCVAHVLSISDIF